MMTSTRAWAPLRVLAPLGVLAASVIALATAYIAQYGYGLEPCVLCLYQRVPYAVAGALAAAALFAGRGGKARSVAWLTGIGAVALLIGGAIAVYHVGVEQHWWASAVCGGELATGFSVQDLQAALMAPPPKSCDAVDWTFLGLSMASWNAIVSPLLAAGAGMAAAALLRGAR